VSDGSYRLSGECDKPADREPKPAKNAIWRQQIGERRCLGAVSRAAVGVGR